VIVLDTNIQNAKKPLRKLPNVITSFNVEGYKKYGKNFVDSWLEYWPQDIRLTVFYEGNEEDFDMVRGVSWHPIESVEFLTDYMDSLKFPLMHGIVGDRYDINFDARMARKSFMQVHACRLYRGKVFWIDADCVTKKHVPLNFLDECLPDDALNCYLGRDGWYYTESGFIGFNAGHPLASRFFKNYVHVFLVGSIFTQPGWHDCFGFDAVRQVMGNGPEFVNLAAHVPHGHMHPFQISAPGQYMWHLKGPTRKETGQLKPEDTLGS
jgi:hypothetical protein